MTQPAVDLLIRYIRQRAELGEAELVLQSLTVADLLTLLPTGSRKAPVHAAEGRAAVVPAHEASPKRRSLVPAAPEPAAVATVDPSIVQIGSLAELQAGAVECTRCRLADSRRHVVFGEGSETAAVMVVGEAPGAEEDRQGRPFVGRAGQLLDRLLASVGFPREEVYICNVLKCRPPGNRDPEADEVEACSAYLYRQIELIRPKVILAVGTFSAQTLLGSREPISRMRGRVHRTRGVELVPTYHPAALLRNPGWIRPAWEDLQLLRTVLAGENTAV